MDIKLSQTQWIGVVGVLTCFVGMFAPLYGALTITVNLLSIWWLAVVFSAALAGALVAIIQRRGRWSMACGLVGFAVVAGLFVRYQTVRADLDDEITSGTSGGDWADDFAEGLGEMAQASLAPQWGWGVLTIGIAAILVASFALMRQTSPQRQDQESPKPAEDRPAFSAFGAPTRPFDDATDATRFAWYQAAVATLQDPKRRLLIVAAAAVVAVVGVGAALALTMSQGQTSGPKPDVTVTPITGAERSDEPEKDSDESAQATESPPTPPPASSYVAPRKAADDEEDEEEEKVELNDWQRCVLSSTKLHKDWDVDRCIDDDDYDADGDGVNNDLNRDEEPDGEEVELSGREKCILEAAEDHDAEEADACAADDDDDD